MQGRRRLLPETLRKRGRAFETIGRLDRAAADFDAAVRELEQSRESLPRGEDRWGVFDSADELFGAAIALALRRGDPRTAFDYAERARARTLLDTAGAPWRRVRPADIPAGTTLIEYAVQHDRTHIFAVDGRGVRVVSKPIERRRVAAAARHILQACAAGDDARCAEASRTLYRWLIEPVAGELTDRRLVIASAELFPVLHRYLARGLAPADALRAAQREWLQGPASSQEIWAAVQIMGE